MIKRFLFAIMLTAVFLACVVSDVTEENVIEVVQYQWWRLEQANLFIDEDTCFYVDPNNLYLYIHFLDTGDYWTYNLEYDIQNDRFFVTDTTFSFWFEGDANVPVVTVRMGGLQKKSEMSLCYPYDSVAVRISKKLSQIVKFVSW
jgi:hypothetical protein